MTDYNERSLVDLVRRPIVTEKATTLLEDNKYVFEVTTKATKPEIKAAIEALFKVKVLKVNTLIPPRKKKRVGKYLGFKPLYKRAIVTLSQSDSITLFPDV